MSLYSVSFLLLNAGAGLQAALLDKTLSRRELGLQITPYRTQ